MWPCPRAPAVVGVRRAGSTFAGGGAGSHGPVAAALLGPGAGLVRQAEHPQGLPRGPPWARAFLGCSGEGQSPVRPSEREPAPPRQCPCAPGCRVLGHGHGLGAPCAPLGCAMKAPALGRGCPRLCGAPARCAGGCLGSSSFCKHPSPAPGSAALFGLQTETLLGGFHCKQQLLGPNKGKLPLS